MILELDAVDASYGQTPVLRNVNIGIESKEIVGVIGRNGAGKTTLMKTIIGLLNLSSGTIRYNGDDISTLPAHERARRGIGYIPQSRGVFPDLTVAENLETGKQINGSSKEGLSDRVYDYFPRLDERQTQKAGTMSGGEQQMLAIARALVGQPELLLLDEPSEGVQPSITKQIATNIQQIRDELGVTVLLVEQNLEFIKQTVGRGYAVENGQIVEELTRSDIKNEEAITRHLVV